MHKAGFDRCIKLLRREKGGKALRHNPILKEDKWIFLFEEFVSFFFYGARSVVFEVDGVLWIKPYGCIGF